MARGIQSKNNRTLAVIAALFLCCMIGVFAQKQKDLQNKASSKQATAKNGKSAASAIKKVTKTDAEWRKQLTQEQYDVTRQAGTEPAFSGEYHNYHGVGIYRCVDCGLELFKSNTKFDSGTGWPSFWQPTAKNHVETSEDTSLGDVRTEVLCARCGAHLGHVFDDGPKPTGLRYCMNSVALKFAKATKLSVKHK